MVRRRSEVTILFDILRIALTGVKVTHLMYKANLSYSTLRKYLSVAMERELINKVNNGDGSVLYHTTKKGKVILKELEDVKQFLPD